MTRRSQRKVPSTVLLEHRSGSRLGVARSWQTAGGARALELGVHGVCRAGWVGLRAIGGNADRRGEVKAQAAAA